MATRRDWNNLSPGQQKRYLGAGRKQGLTDAQIIAHYESGGNVSAWRGQGKARRAGVSERQWKKLRDAAKASQLGRGQPADQPYTQPNDILISLLGKGFSVQQILDWLRQQEESRNTYLSPVNVALRRRGVKNAGIQPGNRRYHGRVKYADIELFYYH